MENIQSKVMQLEMDQNAVELLNPQDYTIDEISVQFDAYRKRRELEQLQINDELIQNFGLTRELDDLRSSLEALRLGIKKLQKEHQQFQLGDINAIIEAPLQVSKNPEEKSGENLEGPLVIRCGSTECIFENCQQRVDKQLLLLHYITDHSGDEAINIEGCHSISPGTKVIFTFYPKHLHIRNNQVLGVLSYRRILVQQDEKDTLLPIVVLTCKIAATVSIMNKNLVECLKARARMKDHVYLIWLVTPNNKVQLTASLCLCGRDSAQMAMTTMGVSWLNHSKNDCHFMPVDKNYWRLSFTKMRQISNGFRDEVNLEISLTESNDNNR